jgi:hypothetical protein
MECLRVVSNNRLQITTDGKFVAHAVCIIGSNFYKSEVGAGSWRNLPTGRMYCVVLYVELCDLFLQLKNVTQEYAILSIKCLTHIQTFRMLERGS